MIQFNNLDYQYQAGSRPSFGSLTGNRNRQVQNPNINEVNPMSNPFTQKAETGNDSLVGRLNRIDAQTLRPFDKNETNGQNLYLYA